MMGKVDRMKIADAGIGYVGLSIAIKNSRMFWCVRCPCGHGYEVKGIEERAVSAGQRP